MQNFIILDLHNNILLLHTFFWYKMSIFLKIYIVLVHYSNIIRCGRLRIIPGAGCNAAVNEFGKISGIKNNIWILNICVYKS